MRSVGAAGWEAWWAVLGCAALSVRGVWGLSAGSVPYAYPYVVGGVGAGGGEGHAGDAQVSLAMRLAAGWMHGEGGGSADAVGVRRALAGAFSPRGGALVADEPDMDPGTQRCVEALNAMDATYGSNEKGCRNLLDEFKAEMVLVAESGSVVISPNADWLDSRCMNPCFPRVERDLIATLRGKECAEVGADDRQGRHFVNLLAQLTDSMCHEHPTKHEYCMVLIAKHAAAWQLLEENQDGQCAESAKDPQCSDKCHTEVVTLLDLLGCCMGDVLDMVAEVTEPEDDVCLADCIAGACKVDFPATCEDSYAVKREDDAADKAAQEQKSKDRARAAWHAFFVILGVLVAGGVAFVAYKVWQAREQNGADMSLRGLYDTLLGNPTPADPWGGDEFDAN